MRNKNQRIYSRRQQRQSGLGAIIKLVLVLATLSALSVLGLVAFAVFSLSSSIDQLALGPPAPRLNAIERLYLQTYLAQNADGLALAVASDDTVSIQFVVAPGERAGGIAQRLQDEGLIGNATLLQNYLRYRGWDSQIEAGTFFLAKSFTIPEVAETLTKALPNEVSVTIWRGWRLEQIAESLSVHPHLAVDQDEFLQLARGLAPPPGNYSFASSIPAGNSLEGFFLPGNYSFAPESTAADVANVLLHAFDVQATTLLQNGLAVPTLTLYEIVILASIVEREAVLEEEYPTIASVYLNRIVIDMRLEADPTTQYGLGQPGNWWPPLNFSPRDVSHAYNTYTIDGLPPAPIANPGLGAIQAVLTPASTEYLFFRAACDGSGRHNFSYTYEEHLEFACEQR